MGLFCQTKESIERREQNCFLFTLYYEGLHHGHLTLGLRNDEGDDGGGAWGTPTPNDIERGD
mgnify:CR=1 FL=1